MCDIWRWEKSRSDKISYLTSCFQRFPDDGLGNVVQNVFDFDSYSREMRETLTEVLHKHGNDDL